MADDDVTMLTDLLLDLKAQTDKNELTPKLMMCGYEFEGQPYISLREDGISIVGQGKKAIVVSPEFGILLSGPIAVSVMPDQISFGGGYWRMNPTLLTCIGSSAATPMPFLVKEIPQLLKAKKTIESTVSQIESQLGVLGKT